MQRCFFMQKILCISWCIICLCSDTDVLVLSFYYSAHVNNHFLKLNLSVFVGLLGKSEEHLLNVSNADYDVDINRALPRLHAVTGFDSVSAFFRRGKVKGFRLLQTKVTFLIHKFAFASNIN